MRVPVLFSFYNIRQYKDTEKLFRNSLSDFDVMLDSGAFSNYKSGKDLVSIEDYVDFVGSNKVENFITFDVIGDPNRTIENTEWILSKGLNPIPVVTVGDDIHIGIKYAEQFPKTAIGGISSHFKGINRKMEFVDSVISMGLTVSKCHFLGVGDPRIICKYKPASSDTATWTLSKNYQLGKVYDEEGKKFIGFKRSNFDAAVKTMRKYKMHNVEDCDFIHRCEGRPYVVTVAEYLRFMSRSLVDNRSKLYFAVSTKQDMDFLKRGMELFYKQWWL